MSDLQCPVRVVLARVDGSWAPADLGPLLARERVVGAWSGRGARSKRNVTALARAAGAPVLLPHFVCQIAGTRRATRRVPASPQTK